MYEPLVQFGAIGIVLAWFMIRSEKKTEALTKAINNNNKILIYVVDAISGCQSNTANLAGGIGANIRTDQLKDLREEILKS